MFVVDGIVGKMAEIYRKEFYKNLLKYLIPIYVKLGILIEMKDVIVNA